jgi:predicted outer membrane repeat protein
LPQPAKGHEHPISYICGVAHSFLVFSDTCSSIQILEIFFLRQPLLSISTLISAAVLVTGQQPNSCIIPAKPVNTTHPTTIVGNGTPASCTEQAFLSAMAAGGIITFNCGPAPVTIPITAERAFRNDMDTVIDGGNNVTLRGTGTTRMFVARSGDAPWRGGTPPYYKSTRTAVTFQYITLSNGKSSGTRIPPLPPGAPTKCSQGTEIDGSGGLIFVRDMVLRVINSKVTANRAASVGPDVAGGAIYALGSLEVTIVGSIFDGNEASNGGALGTLMSNVIVVKNVFQNNRAVGHDGNHNIQSSGCPIHLDQYQVGSGGSGGATYHDGQVDRGITYCGNVFRQNQGGLNAMGGAIWGAGDKGTQTLVITQSEFERNTGAKGGAIYAYDARFTVTRSAFIQNTATFGGAIQTDKTQLTALNNTFSGNSATSAVGTIALFTCDRRFSRLLQRVQRPLERALANCGSEPRARGRVCAGSADGRSQAGSIAEQWRPDAYHGYSADEPRCGNLFYRMCGARSEGRCAIRTVLGGSVRTGSVGFDD